MKKGGVAGKPGSASQWEEAIVKSTVLILCPCKWGVTSWGPVTSTGFSSGVKGGNILGEGTATTGVALGAWGHGGSKNLH